MLDVAIAVVPRIGALHGAADFLMVGGVRLQLPIRRHSALGSLLFLLPYLVVSPAA